MNDSIKACLAAACLALPLLAQGAETLTIATVNNNDMIRMQRLSKVFEESHPDISLKWVVLEENVLRQRLTTDIATQGGQFDLLTIGMYEAALWGAKGWLEPMSGLPADYALDDLLPSVRDGLSVKGTLYALPFYAEASITYYRKDLFQQAGLRMPEQPTWTRNRRIRRQAQPPGPGPVRHLPARQGRLGREHGVDRHPGQRLRRTLVRRAMAARIQRRRMEEGSRLLCLHPQAVRPARRLQQRIQREPGAVQQRQVRDLGGRQRRRFVRHRQEPEQGRRRHRLRLRPREVTDKGASWLYSWALAIPASSRAKDAAKAFATWATSQAYGKLVADREGVANVPPGTRASTYSEAYLAAAPFARVTLESLKRVDPNHPTLKPVPYVGIQLVTIPEFQAIGTQVGKLFSAALTGQMSSDQALAAAQQSTAREMKRAGYPK